MTELQTAATVRDFATSDAELVDRFFGRGDGAALAALIERHGRTVWNVCRRVLPTHEDAEDAFQAVFLILTRSGRSIRNKGAVGGWLYGVAYRTAMKARRSLARRKRQTKSVPPPPPPPSPVGVAICRELHLLLDEEVDRLPEKLKSPFVLCCIEGLSKSEAAQSLGWKEGTVSGRLAQARKLLQSRLTRRGVTFSAVLTALALGKNAAAVAVPPLLVQSTIAGVSAPLAAKAAAGLSPVAVQLAEGFFRAAVAAKVKAAGAIFLAVSLAAGSVAVATTQLADAPPAQRPAPGRTVVFAGPPVPFLEVVDEQVLAVAFSPDGERLVTAGARHQHPGQVTIWDIAARKQSHKVRKVRGTRCVAFSPDGRTLACGEFGGAITLRDGMTGETIATLRGHNVGVNGVAFSPDGASLLSAGLDGTVKLWDVKARAERKTFFGLAPSVFSVASFHDGKRFVTGGGDRTATVWDATQDQATFRLAGHENIVEMVAVSPDDKVVATASWDRTLKLWDADTGTMTATLTGHQAPVFAVAFSADGALLASGSADGEVRLWDAKAHSLVARLGNHDRPVWSVAFSPNDKLLASGSSDTTAKLWDVAAKTELSTLSTSELGRVHAVAYSPNGKQVAIATDDKAVRVYDADTGKPRTVLSGHADKVMCLAYAPDGHLLASGSSDKTVRLWDPAAGSVKHVLARQGGPVHAVAFSPDGKKLASAGDDKTVNVWEPEAGTHGKSYDGHTGPVYAVAFGPGGSTLASGSADKTVLVWDLDRAAEPVKLEGHEAAVRALTFVGLSLVSGGDDGAIQVWEPAGRAGLTAATKPRSVKWPAPVRTLASLEGIAGFVSGAGDGTIRQWDTGAGATPDVLVGHELPVASLALRPGGKELLSAGLDGRVMRWREGGGPKPVPPRPPRVAANNLPPVPEKLEELKELYQDYRHNKVPELPVSIFGTRAAAVTHPDEHGLHVAVEANPQQTQRIGVKLRRLIRGDFEVTAAYEVVHADQPKDGHGVGVCLIASLASPHGEVLEVMRTARLTEGEVYGTCRKTVDAGKDKYDLHWVPTASRAGHLRITRIGSEVIYSAREGGAERFKELFRAPCGVEDVNEVLFAAYMGFAPNSVDVFLKDLRIGPPGAATPAVPDASEPVAEAPRSPTRGRSYLILGGILVLALLLAAIGLLLHYRRRREADEEPVADSIDETPQAPVAFACPGCGKTLRVRATMLVGKVVKCPGCGQRLVVPRPGVGSDDADG